MSQTAIINRTGDSQIETWAHHALSVLECDIRAVIIEWNSRFTRRMGDACIKNGVGVVRLSRPLWSRATDADHQQTVVHELCHVVQRHKYGRHDAPHGRIWQHYMRKCGFEPRRCHSVKRDDLRRQTRKYAARCACQTHEVGAVRARRIVSGTMSYVCKKCRGKLQLVDGDTT
jgi:SprT protein